MSQVLILSTDDAAHTSLPSPCSLVGDASIWATSPQTVVVRRVFYGFVLFCFVFLPVMLPSEVPKLPIDPPVREITVWKLLLHSSLHQEDGSPSLTLCLSFCLLYFALPPFKENGLPFWVPGVLRQCSEVVLQKLISIQMIFVMNLWGRKWSPCPIPLPSQDHPPPIILNFKTTLLLRNNLYVKAFQEKKKSRHSVPTRKFL